MLSIRRLLTAALIALATALVPLAVSTASALAAKTQVTELEEDGALEANPVQVMGLIRKTGVTEVRMYLEWSSVAPNPTSYSKPGGFDSASNGGYNWSRYDNIVHAALNNHIKLDVVLGGGAPLWAWGPGIPSGVNDIHYAWKPSPTEYGNFVHAALLQYGRYVHTWEIYNEPNFGEDLAPQIVNRAYVAAQLYRGLVDAAWSAFSSTHHTHDTIVVGQVTARNKGGATNNNFGQSEPLTFMRGLYCVGTNLKPLTGRSATAIGCPSNGKGFASAHPGLFKSSGFGIHPYPQGLPPTKDSSHDANYITFNTIPRLEKDLAGIAKAYHTHSGGVYNNEYGYVTRPPNSNHIFASPANAATYINQAEYLSWKDPQIKTYMQYLLFDPPSGGNSQFFSGLYFSNGTPKPTYFAFRMPLWLPSSTVKKGKTAEVWGGARPYATVGGHGKIAIQWRKNSHAAWTTVANVSPGHGTGYFDTKVKFPGSGQVQTEWSESGVGVIASRTATITVH